MGTLVLLILCSAWCWWWYFELKRFALSQGHNCKGMFKRQKLWAILFTVILVLYAFYLFFVQHLTADEWF